MRTDLDAQAMQDALDALNVALNAVCYNYSDDSDGLMDKHEAAIATLRERLAQPEPVGSAIPSFLMREIDQAIESALHPTGMSTHDGKAAVQVTTLQYLLRMIAAAPEAVPAHQSAQPEPVSANSTLTQQAMSLYKPPFRFNRGYIWDTDNKMVADDDAQDVALRVRGWGAISYKPNPEALQDEVGRLIAEALTQYWQATAPEAAPCTCAGCSKKASEGWALYCVECCELIQPSLEQDERALTDEQILHALQSVTNEVPSRLPPGWKNFARAIERVLKGESQ